MDVRVVTDGDGWLVIVDGVIRARSDLFDACRIARRWGW